MARDKDYDLTQGKPGSRVMYFTANPNGEAEVIRIQQEYYSTIETITFDNNNYMNEEVLDIYHDIMYLLVGAIYNVHNELGPGLNEYIYQEGLAIELTEQNIPYEREKEITISYRNHPMKATYRLDMFCCNCAVIECKSVECLTQNHRAQLFNYMRLVEAPIGILVNFAQKTAVVERYFYDKQTKEICDINGNPFQKQ